MCFCPLVAGAGAQGILGLLPILQWVRLVLGLVLPTGVHVWVPGPLVNRVGSQGDCGLRDLKAASLLVDGTVSPLS